MKTLNKAFKFILSLLIIVIFSAIITFIIYKTNNYPKGNDVYGHLYKIKILYEEILNGNYYPIFTPNWYNGIELFRYWPPASYYFYCIFMFIAKGNIYNAFLLFIFFVSVIGGIGWLLFGLRENKMGLCLVIGLLYFILPDNLRVFFSEGNIPRIFITMLLPYIFFFIHEFLVYKKKYALIILAPFIVLLVCTHIMISAMFGIAAFLYLLIYAIVNKKYKISFVLLFDLVFGYLTAGVILIPGLIGGIVTQNSSASQATSAAMWSEYIFNSLNPIIRFENFGAFYFGISLFAVILLGLFTFRKYTLPGFLTCFILFIGTSMIVVPIISALPMSQVFWMIRFIPIAEVVFLIAIIYWKQLKKLWLVIFLSLIFIDSTLSFKCVIEERQSIKEEENEIVNNYLLEKAASLTDNRFALMDLSLVGSYPSYYIIQEKNINYLFGWAYQGAFTIREIVNLNEAFENGYYTYVFDRLIEYGCDTVVIKKDLVKTKKDWETLEKAAKNLNYELIEENEYARLYDLTTVHETYGLIPTYENVCIGANSEYLAFLYPSFYKLSNDYLDDYTFEDLKDYKKIYLAGPYYRDKKYCEDLVLKLASSGIKIYVDINNLQDEKSIGRNSFLGVTAQPIAFTDVFPVIEMKNGTQFKLKPNTKIVSEWRTYFLSNLQHVYRKSEYKKGRYLSYVGTSKNENITFLGLNLVYFCASDFKENEQLYKFLDEIFEEKRDFTPKKQIVPVKIISNKNSFIVHSEYGNVDTTLSNLDSFKINRPIKDSTFLYVNKGDTKVEITRIYLAEGLFCSLIGILLYLNYWLILWISPKFADLNN